MPKFVVRKGHDAFVYYETVVEADTSEEARSLAKSVHYDGEWLATGDVQVSYTAAALTGKQVNAGTKSNIRVCIEGDGVNRANGKRVKVSIPCASLSASGAQDLVGDEFLVSELTGTAIKLPGREAVEVVYID